MGDIDISKIKQSKNIWHKVPESEVLAKSIQQKGLLQLWMVVSKSLLAVGGFALAKL
jgi:hypothetical protein